MHIDQGERKKKQRAVIMTPRCTSLSEMKMEHLESAMETLVAYSLLG